MKNLNTLNRLSREMRRRLILCTLFFLTAFFLPQYAMATIGGSGTSSNPYTINSEADFYQLRSWMTNSSYDNKYWRLTTDIYVLTMASGGSIFKGTLDGCGYTITTWDNTSVSGQYTAGLFSHAQNSTIKNLNLRHGTSYANNISGAVVAIAENCTFENVHVTTTNNNSIFYGTERWGGIAGSTIGTVNITGCSVVWGKLTLANGSAKCIGGLIGRGYGELNVKDCMVDITYDFNANNKNQRDIGGLIGSLETSGSKGTFIRCFVKDNISNAGNSDYARGRIAGYIESGSTLNAYAVWSATSTDYVGAKNGTTNFSNGVSNTYASYSSSWTPKEVYDRLERVNDNGATIASNTAGNARWGYFSNSRPQLAKPIGNTYNTTDATMRIPYLIRITKGDNIAYMCDLPERGYVGKDGDNYYYNFLNITSGGDLIFFIGGKTACNENGWADLTSHQRMTLTFTFDHNSPYSGYTNKADYMSKTNYLRYTGYASGKVNSPAGLEEIPYPYNINDKENGNITGSFDKWNSKVTIDWKYDNPSKLTGKFYVYRKKQGTADSNYQKVDDTGVAVDNTSANLNGITTSKTFTLPNADLDVRYTFCVVFVEGNTSVAPAWASNAHQKTVVIETYLNVDDITNFSVESGTNFINVTFNQPSGMPSNSNLTYTIERKKNDIAMGNLVSNQQFGGATKISHSETPPFTSCDLFSYKLIVNAWGKTFTVEEKSGSITGATDFNASKPFKASKGAYASYVRLEWNTTSEVQSGNTEVFRVFRKVATAPDSEYVELETVNSPYATTYWNDNTALPGIYYQYKVTIYKICNSTETAGNSVYSIGYSQSFGTVIGRVTYGSGIAVKGVNMIAKKNDINTSVSQYYSLKSAGSEGNMFEWVDTVKFKTIAQNKNWTLQFWVRPDGTNTSNAIIGRIGRYNIYLMPVTGGYQIYTGMGTAQRSDVIPANKFTHIIIQRNGNTVNIYTVNDNNFADIKLETTTFTCTTDTNSNSTGIALGQALKGHIDDVRFWKKALTTEEIMNSYDRIITGAEDDLIGYWNFDEGLNGYAFDMSRVGTVYNNNHATAQTLTSDRTVLPNPEYQLSLKAVTDADGNYQISGVPFSGEGTSYSIVPTLGVHVFNPTQQLRYISPTSMVHNATDFTDISSFEVSGFVTYNGGTYPVQGCSFEIDGLPVTKSNGELVVSSDIGYYNISVPIGYHSVRVVKQGHTFENDGYITNPDGTKLNYIKPENVDFFDNTRINFTGRIVGGLIEHNKPLGFGESVNNIGATTITLKNTRPQYEFSTVSYSETFSHNNGQWKKPNGTLSDDETTVTYNQEDIVITVSPVSGEFVAWIYPESYDFTEIKVPGAGGAQVTVYNNNERRNLSSAPVPNDSYLKTSIRTWIDSTFIANKPGVVNHWEYFEKSDTVRFHDSWTYYYQSTPTFSVTQKENDQLVEYFGDKTYTLDTEIPLYNDVSHSYLFGKPVFRQGSVYEFFMKSYEEYSNYTTNPSNPVIARYPVKDGNVNMMNNIRLNPEPESIPMDANGESSYIFLAGAPNLTTGSNDFFATITIGAMSYYWDMGTTPFDAWHLGDRTTGTDFLTGPDEVTAILRDPPGSNSTSFIETGTSITVKKSNTITDGMNEAMELTTSLGPKITTFIGLGAGVITEVETKIDISAGIKAEEKWSSATEFSTTTSFTERFETSDDPLYVGHYGDVFIGNSTNILYGITNGISIVKDYLKTDAFETAGAYSIAPSASIAYGQTFDTRFAFTEVDLVEIMIPKWKMGLGFLLQPKGTVVDTNTITHPVYVSNLLESDGNFGKLNTDKVAFGASASTSAMFYKGPSYTIYFPKNYDKKDFKLDSVMYFNNQINGWIAILAQNEKEKVEMQHLGNYSFGSGATIQYSKTNTATESVTSTFNWVLNPSVGLVTGGEVMGIGLELEVSMEYVHEEESSTGTEIETTITSGFTLKEEGDDDQITVDYGMTKSGTIAFKTRGGRTSCPYEDGYVTQYFEPGLHIIDEATMQIEVPKIRVQSAPMVLNVPSNRDANFTIAMENESQTGEDVWFQLIVDEATNPDGAILKIDGGVIGNGRFFLVKAGQTLLKTLTVGKGTADTYNNIALVLRSQCQSDPTDFLPDIADTTYISVEFVPACSEVAITEPKQNWILNADSKTGDTLYVSIEKFDVNFPNFGFIKLEYRPTSDPDWKTLVTYYPTKLYKNGQGTKEDIGTRSVLVYPWKTPEADGAYELRATTASVNIVGDTLIMGDPLSTFTTDAVAGYRDVSRPASLGAPSPANGILGIGDELSITFNEDIQTGMLTKNNFSISGVLNAQEIAEPNVGLGFSGTQAAQTELPIFTNGSFSIETWFKRDLGSSGTLFTYGSNNNYISLGFNASGNAVLTHGSETYTSANTITDDDTWKFIAMAYDRDDNTVSVYEFEGKTLKKLFILNALTNTLETQGKLIVGNNATNSNGFSGAVSQLHFYGINRDEAAISADKSVTKSGREYGLIGYWMLDEGEGASAKDKARSRHLSVNNAGWYIYPSGFAKQTNNNYFAIPTSSYPLNIFSDFTLEFWFRSETVNSQPNQTIFCNDNCYIATNATDGLTLYKSDGTLISTLNSQLSTLNSQWHHFALSVRRNGTANVFIDGANAAVFPETQLGSFDGGYCYFGAKYTTPNTFTDYFAGYFDEIRIWNSALTKESILLNKNSKLHGDEAGLQAYYPFENYVKQSNGIITVDQTNDNIAVTDTFKVAGTAMGFSTTAMSVKDVRPVENIQYLSGYTYVASNNKIVFTLNSNNFARVEGTTLTLTVKDVRDMRNNKSNTEQWTAFVKRNPLQWDTDPVYMKIQKGETKSFTAKIMNVGGTSVSYSIENLPSWLTVNYPTGNLQPLSNRELTFTVTQGVNIGNYEAGIGLTCGNGVTEILPVQLKVTGERPDWNVDPYDFQFSMNITGQVQIEGIFQEDTDDLLGAFIGDLCVGVTSPIFVTSKNAYYTFADIYGNSEHNKQPLQFKLWDASTGRIYPVIETSVPNIQFKPSQIIGSTTNPVIFNALNYAEQIIPLKKGWTWISSNVLNDNPTILDQMKHSLSETGVIIKGRRSYVQQPEWLGNLTEISEKSMYLINTTAEHSLILSGVYANAATTPITINQGWNWIGYIPTLSLSVMDALAGMNAQDGDQIKGQIGYATYTGAEWIGSLTFMQAGKGYMYHSGNGTPQTFVYPTAGTRGDGTKGRMDERRKGEEEKGESGRGVAAHWVVDDAGFSSSMTMTAIVIDGGTEMRSDQIELGVFSGSVCHGSALLQYVSSLDRYMGFLMIYGNGGETINLKVYDHTTSTEHSANNAPIIFISDLMFGSPAAPYAIEIGTTTPLSTDATLSNLTVSAGTLTPAFSSSTFDYIVNVDFAVTSVTLSATSTDANATVTGTGAKTLALGNNVFTIVVTAEDGTTELTYTVTVNRAYNTVATLSNLTTTQGALTPMFNSTTFDYIVNVDFTVTSLTLTGTATDANATVTGTGLKTLALGNNVFTIVVTAQDGTTTLTYTVTVNRAYNTVASLSNLTVSSGTLSPAFSSTTYSYSVNVAYSVSSVSLSATSTDANATVTGDGLKNLNIGNNVFIITVTAQDGIATLTYTVSINRGYNTVATLSNLTVSAGVLTPAFSSATYNYSVNVPFNVALVTLDATPTDPNATVTGTGLKTVALGENTFIITVTAQDGVTTQNYIVTVNRAANTDATLVNLSVSAGALNPMFNSATYSYTVNVPYNVTSLILAATATDANATVLGDGIKSLNVGNNMFDITVTAQDDVTELTYTVTINRGYNTVATLSNLTVSAGTLTPAFSSTTYSYSVNVPYSASSVTLSATSTDANATITGDGLKNLNIGSNIFTVTVTAQDGVTVLNYTVTVNRGYNTVATLSNLTVSAGTLTPAFSSTTYTYSVNVPYSVSSVTLSATSTDANAIVTGTGIKPLTTGNNVFTITVTAQDGITVLNYTVTINRALSNNAALSNLSTSSGALNPMFTGDVYYYTVNVPYSVPSVTLSATSTDPNATVTGAGLKNLTVGSNVFTVTVTAQDGVTELTYTVTVNRSYNNIATLSDLTVSEGTLSPAFSSTTYSYSVNVPYSVSSVTLSATSTDANATVTGTGIKALALGNNVFTIMVTAEDGATTQNYTVTVTRAIDNTVALLSNLSVSVGTLSPMFNSTIYSYSVNVPYSVSSVTLSATSTDANGTVAGTGIKTLEVGENIFTITVTAQDEATSQTYTVTVNRGLNAVATLSELATSEGELSPAFNSNVFFYTMDLTDDVTEMTLTATSTDTNATVVGDGVKAINLGNNMFTITVIAQDGVTELNYVVMVNCRVGIVETLRATSIQVYPNPTAGELHVTSDALHVTNVEVFDLPGKRHVTQVTSNVSPVTTINISHLPAGTYFVRVTTEKGVVIRKVVKK